MVQTVVTLRLFLSIIVGITINIGVYLWPLFFKYNVISAGWDPLVLAQFLVLIETHWL